MSQQSDANLPIAEYSVSPTFVDGLAVIETIGAVTHLSFTMKQRDPCNNKMERAIQARLIVPTDQLAVIGRLLLDGRIPPIAGMDDAGEPVGIH
jgi:hypothetical protein